MTVYDFTRCDVSLSVWESEHGSHAELWAEGPYEGGPMSFYDPEELREIGEALYEAADKMEELEDG